MKKIIITILLITMLLFTACAQEQRTSVTVKYYDAQGNLLETHDLTSQLNTQAIISQLPTMPSNTASISYTINVENTGNVPITVTIDKAQFTGEY